MNYGQFSEDFSTHTHTSNLVGNTGEIKFTTDSISYKFVNGDTIESGHDVWHLKHMKQNAGFVKVDKYQIEIGDKFLFDVFFEDGTTYSERNAKRATLTQIATKKTSRLYQIEIQKNEH